LQHIAIVGWEEGLSGQVESWIESTGYSVNYFIHPNDTTPKIFKIKRHVDTFSYPENGRFKNKHLYCNSNWAELVSNNLSGVLIAISDPHERSKQIKYAKYHNIRLINAIHPTSILNANCLIGENVIIESGAIVGYKVELSDGVVLNTGVQIDHHSLVEYCATANPGVTTASNVKISRFSIVHTGAIIINKITVGENSIIGAGAVVIKDVESNTTVAGVPAKPIK
jgi:serine O-acetyltransferase